MRDWEGTFPQELWIEFGRLNNIWKGTVRQRPKYWGILVTELGLLVPGCGCLQVAKGEQTASSKGPEIGINGCLSSTALRKLVQHIYTLIGIAKNM